MFRLTNQNKLPSRHEKTWIIKSLSQSISPENYKVQKRIMNNLSLPPIAPLLNLKSTISNLLWPHSYNLVNGYVCQFPFIFEGEYIICTGFYGPLENIRPTTVNVYGTFEVVLYYKRLHHAFITPDLPFLITGFAHLPVTNTVV